MSFLKKKEQVLDIQLTSYGKMLLAQGKLKPEYYAFFDDGILYDSRFANFEEFQNESQDRIIHETPYTEVQPHYDGVDTKIQNNIDLLRKQSTNIEFKDLALLQPTQERQYGLKNSLGNISLISENLPAWNVSVGNGEINSSFFVNSGSLSNLKIPQINMKDIEITTEIIQSDPIETYSDKFLQPDNINSQEMDLDLLIEKFNDGSYIKVHSDYIELIINEENVDNLKDNFDIELFEIENTTNHNGEVVEKLIPLSFKKEFNNIIDGILVDDVIEQDVEITPEFAEYYFDILVDDEIDDNLIELQSSEKTFVYDKIVRAEDLEEEC